MSSHIEFWPELKELGEFANHIDRFGKFGERIYLITKDDHVYAFGNQSRKQNLFSLGEENTGHNVSKPMEIAELRNQKIVKFISGENHMLALSTAGAVWTWGENVYGQLGTGDRTNHFRAIKIEKVTNVKDIVGNRGNSLVLKGDGNVFAWGENVQSETGIGNENDYEPSPVKVGVSSIVTLQATFFGTSLAINNKSQILAWGTDEEPKPSFINSPSPFVSIAPVYYHFFILSKEGQIFKSHKFDQSLIDVFYNGTIKFQSIYGDHHSNPGQLIAQSFDGKIYDWQNSELNGLEPRQLAANDIVEAFALYHNKAFLPFMVQLSKKIK